MRWICKSLGHVQNITRRLELWTDMLTNVANDTSGLIDTLLASETILLGFANYRHSSGPTAISSTRSATRSD
jgi:hypothetical protein